MADPSFLFLMSLSSERGISVMWELLGKPLNFHRCVREWKVRIMGGSTHGVIGSAFLPVLS